MRGKQTVRDMVLSMTVIGAVVAVIYLFLPNDDEDRIKPVDYRMELVTAQRAAPYPLMAPQGLSQGWKPTSVRYDRNAGSAWHLGFLDPDREYIAIEQSTQPYAKYVSKVTLKAVNTGGTQLVNGVAWERWEGEKYDALVLRDKADGVTTVVTGTAPLARLTEMAESLKGGMTVPSAQPSWPGSTATPAPSAKP
ncbi:DUF4245 domain-containing protein [Streptomyces sp. NPDC058953]|uniref:DUF4245 domain-containing protein n=1 Tax=unclassified Streptomyces TaxID=2593676 RepID=UPI003688EBF5